MTVDKDRIDALKKILKEEFGITTEKELDEAIKRQKKINLAPFLSLPSQNTPKPL